MNVIDEALILEAQRNFEIGQFRRLNSSDFIIVGQIRK
jgi:hypothetical protein